ncbi:MAG: hypothetical protein IIA50_00820 [Bacteroidetes bacterium]|nr:hypothetical protein [Bacteroidota bacterium]
MKSRTVTAEETVDLISEALQEEFPNTVFAVRLEEPLLCKKDIQGVDVIWVDGPKRDQVEDALDQFQGVTWDPRTGVLEGRSHYVVDGEGELIQVFYNIDYIFCDGPSSIVHS